MMLTARLFLVAVLVGSSAHAQSVTETAEEVGKSAGNIVTKPLKDANIVKAEIPPKLAAIMNNPYSLDGLKTCAQFSGEIAQLTKVLGPDVDATQSKKDQSATEVMLGEVERQAAGLIPGSGIIRKVSGAEKQEAKAKAAIYAGSLRRAYLKGTARAKGCKF
ncbi:hypothetical protein [Sandaracinobacteroides hominis]|uniref:hypothetical protein n=1 Tax=Sandaracinobacteroides hominis TaxID=2780086 RepID=UPI0018F48245|nr:hypothetical protein [Sandaracinobacteroides hominis]